MPYPYHEHLDPDPGYMEHVAPNSHVQVPILSAIGRGPGATGSDDIGPSIRELVERVNGVEEDLAEKTISINNLDDQVLDLSEAINLKADRVMASQVYSNRALDNAVIQFTVEESGSLQGNTPFSFSGDYSFDADDIMFAMMVGQDSAKVLVICDKHGDEISRQTIAGGHFGNITFDGDHCLYAMNYVYEGHGDGLLYRFDVSDPANVVWTTMAPDTSANGGNPWTMSFNYHGNIALGLIDNGMFKFWEWDYDNSFNKLVEIPRESAPLLSASMSHFTYDEENDLFMRHGNKPNTVAMYDSFGNRVNVLQIPEFVGLTSSGELEQFNKFGRHCYFGTRYYWSSRKNVTPNPVMQQFYFDVESGIAGVPSPYTQTRVVEVRYDLPYGRCYVNSSNNHLIVKYDFQACLVANNIENIQSIVLMTEYPNDFLISDMTRLITFSAGNATLNFMQVRETQKVVLSLDQADFIDNNNGMTVNSVVYKIVISNADAELRNDLQRINENTKLCYIANSQIFAQGLKHSRIRNTFFKARVLESTSVENGSCGIIVSGTDNTVDANSKVV